MTLRDRLSLGDFAFCHHKTNSLLMSYVIERKSSRDLVASIIDGRFQQQKTRLMKLHDQTKKCNVVVLIEIPSNKADGFKKSTIEQACVNALVLDGFQIVYCRNPTDTARYLTEMTRYLNKHFNLSMERIPLDNFNEKYAKRAIINRDGGISVREAVARFLVQIKGVSEDKVAEFVMSQRDLGCFPGLLQYIKKNHTPESNLVKSIRRIFSSD
ncbi:hypothetical protein ACOME3_003376 [Neoechinorhynchus agilis]